MLKFKSIWNTILGSITSIIPLFFTACKSGVCATVCVSPIASILGISSASLVASPLTQSLFPLLLVISAVSFTVSYYKLYVLPKYSSNCNTDCACEKTKDTFQYKFSVWTFWIGLVASIIFITYFEFQNYKANMATKSTLKIEQTTNSIINEKAIYNKDKDTPCCSNGEECK